MKIGIVTIFDVPNYGTVLQAFALRKSLENIGNEVNIINYTRKNSWVEKHIAVSRPNCLKVLAHKLRLTSYGRFEAHLNEFRKYYLGLTQKYNTLEELENEDWRSYQIFITGSDQVWNSNYIYGDSVYMLSFVPNGVSKISIGASFAQKQLDEKYLKKYKQALQQYKALSVREINGKHIIENQLGIGINVKVVVDPTLLLSKETWLDAFPISTRLPSKYILFYMLDYAFEPKPYIFEVAKYFQQKMNCQVLALVGYKRCANAAGLKMKDVSDSDIPEYINYFKHASLVITSSFHGTAFALNFARPLVSVVPSNGDDRQTTLLNQLGVEQCAVKVNTSMDSINPYYDVVAEQTKLEILRNDSLEWIKNNCNLNNIKNEKT